MKKVRFGIVGVGIMGSLHAKDCATKGGRSFNLGAVCDIDGQLAEKIGREYSAPHYTDAREMYNSGLVDAVIIAVPHYSHGPLTITAARRGLGVLCEKPLSSSVSDATAMIAECRKRKVALGAMLQQRTEPYVIKMKQLVDRGAIGEVLHVEMICSNWFRTQTYYDSGQWRGTWDGEGGGVLINQAPHSLDLFQWVGLGLPKRVIALLNTRDHKIEVEDTANILCDYGKGRTGYIYATTAEEPGTFRLSVIGDRGTLICDGNKLTLGKLKVPISRHIRTATSLAGAPGEQSVTWKNVKTPDKPSGHWVVIKAFADHLLKGTPMIATAAEALNELELSNAAYLSGFNDGETVDLPVDGAKVDRLLARLERQRSTGRGRDLRRISRREMRKLLRKN